MKALAMQIWEMPAGEFSLWLMAFVGSLLALRFFASELALLRMKRMRLHGLR